MGDGKVGAGRGMECDYMTGMDDACKKLIGIRQSIAALSIMMIPAITITHPFLLCCISLLGKANLVRVLLLMGSGRGQGRAGPASVPSFLFACSIHLSLRTLTHSLTHSLADDLMRMLGRGWRTSHFTWMLCLLRG